MFQKYHHININSNSKYLLWAKNYVWHFLKIFLRRWKSSFYLKRRNSKFKPDWCFWKIIHFATVKKSRIFSVNKNNISLLQVVERAWENKKDLEYRPPNLFNKTLGKKHWEKCWQVNKIKSLLSIEHKLLQFMGHICPKPVFAHPATNNGFYILRLKKIRWMTVHCTWKLY